jgi:hypothetical protein
MHYKSPRVNQGTESMFLIAQHLPLVALAPQLLTINQLVIVVVVVVIIHVLIAQGSENSPTFCISLTKTCCIAHPLAPNLPLRWCCQCTCCVQENESKRFFPLKSACRILHCNQLRVQV